MQKKRLRIVALSAALLACLSAGPARVAAQGGQARQGVDLGAFIKEVMVVDIQGDNSQLAMWFPYEFFLAATMSEGAPREAAERETEFVKPFIIMFIQNKSDLPDGRSTYLGEKEVRARAVLRAEGGAEVRPLVQTPPKLAATLAAIKTLITAEGDAGSANMHIVVFPNSTPQGRTIVNSSQRESLTLVLKAPGSFKETVFNWRTPFDAMSNTPPCPRCKQAMSSKWSYCPYDGQKLSQ